MLIECNLLQYGKFLISALCNVLQKAEIGYTCVYMGLAWWCLLSNVKTLKSEFTLIRFISHMPVPSYKAVIVSSFKNNSNNKKSKRKKSKGFTSILVRKLFHFVFPVLLEI